jgi:hypothetical protein
VLGRQAQIRARQVGVELIEPAGADDRGRDAGRDCTQASATAAGVVPSDAPRASPRRGSVKVRSVSRDSERVPRSDVAVAASSRVNLPLNTPPAIGDHGVMPSPSSCAIGTSSPSTVRSSSEYSICSATSGVQPRKSAVVCACDTFHAGVSRSRCSAPFPPHRDRRAPHRLVDRA